MGVWLVYLKFCYELWCKGDPLHAGTGTGLAPFRILQLRCGKGEKRIWNGTEQPWEQPHRDEIIFSHLLGAQARPTYFPPFIAVYINVFTSPPVDTSL